VPRGKLRCALPPVGPGSVPDLPGVLGRAGAREPPPEQALRFLAGEDERGGDERGEERGGDAPRSGRRAVVGSPQTVRAKLAEVVDSYGAEEAIVVCIAYDHDARRRSYELLAEAFEL
jgi:alkanesulfonate monooxygenase SsuD/methylene tetrahydromethanopterin reductase-like flavin-dependent oxidoreductase (luciferase family)